MVDRLGKPSEPSMEFKTVLVTGAARGIGRACAVAFARSGASVALLDIATALPDVPYDLGNESQLEHTMKCCEAEGVSVLFTRADIRDRDAVSTFIDKVINRFGRLDVVVNNAGIVAPAGKLVHELSETEWQTQIGINLTGAWQILTLAASTMIAQRAGSIINISSTAGLVGYRNFAGYVSSKHGVIGLTKAAALDLAPYGVRVNAICPGSVLDDERNEGRMLQVIADTLDISQVDRDQAFLRDQPTNQLISAEEVASFAVYLGSLQSSGLTGAILPIDGGFTSR